jgi:hypothetical protein
MKRFRSTHPFRLPRVALARPWIAQVMQGLKESPQQL